jgi:hypothetical protein
MTVSLLMAVTGYSQKQSNFAAIDKLALGAAGDQTSSAADIARYFIQQFESDRDRTRAAFIWIASNLKYDVENMYNSAYYRDKAELVKKILKTRRGLCMHYATLYEALLAQMGIKSHIIIGYTRQHGQIDRIAHAWNAVYLDGNWYLSDATWGAGYVQNKRFIKEINDNFFLAKPADFAISHMPFDPLWQFSELPLNHIEFTAGKKGDKRNTAHFNYLDSLTTFEQQSEVERLKAALQRADNVQGSNSMVKDFKEQSRKEIDFYYNQQNMAAYNKAIDYYNAGIDALNEFLSYRNQKFQVGKSDVEIQQVIDTAETTFLESRTLIRSIEKPDKTLITLRGGLEHAIQEALQASREQQIFMKKWMNADESARRKMF